MTGEPTCRQEGFVMLKPDDVERIARHRHRRHRGLVLTVLRWLAAGRRSGHPAETTIPLPAAPKPEGERL